MKTPKIITIHALQSVGASRLNANRDGSLKDIVLGGVNRVRVSSQAFKRAMRNYTHTHGLIPEDQRAYRSRLLNENLKARLLNNGNDETVVDSVIESVFAALGMKIKDNKNEYLIFYGANELEKLLSIITSNWNTLSSISLSGDNKKSRAKEIPANIANDIKNVFSSIPNIEVSLYGRQLADLPDGNADGAVQIAHAFSINPFGDASDFFTAVDDLQREGGSGHLDEREISAPTLYRCGAINVAQLENAIGQNAVKDAINAFLVAFVNAFPASGKNSFAAASLPEFVLLEQTSGHLINQQGAFTQPVYNNVMEAGITRLGEYMSKMDKMYPNSGVLKRVCVSIHNTDSFSGLNIVRVDSVHDAFREVQQ